MYCYNCGEMFNPNTDKYCKKCGVSFYLTPPRNRKRNVPTGFVIVFILIVIGVFSPFVFKWLFGSCGVVPMSRTIADLEGYAEHLKQLEDATINNKKPPTYLLAQIDGDIISLSWPYDECVTKSYQALNNTLAFASNYFGDLPPFEMSDVDLMQAYGGMMIERRYKYEGSLREFYSELGKLKSCHPFCNLDTLFQYEVKGYAPPSSPQKDNNYSVALATQQAQHSQVLQPSGTQQPPPKQQPYIVQSTYEKNIVPPEIESVLNDWVSTSAPVYAPYWFVTSWNYADDGRVLVSLVGVLMSSPDEKWTLVNDTDYELPSEVVWFGSVEIKNGVIVKVR